MSYSYPFYGWNNLSRFYYQAKEIADYAASEQISEMGAQSVAVRHLKTVIMNNPALNNLQLPDLLAVKRYDKQHNTEYFYALQAYLLSGCRVEMASRILDIHPNTLRYRIKKLEDILPGNLYNADYRRELIYSALLP